MKEFQSPDTLFDALAEDYESMRREVAWDPFVHIHAAFDGFDWNGVQALDAGCGTGECTRWMQAQGAVPVGIDISGEMCFHAAEKSENIMFITHDMNNPLPFDSCRFDAVTALGCLEYLPDFASAVREFHRVMKPGAVFLGCFERYGDDCPGGCERETVMFDEWMRYRQSREDLETVFNALFDDVRFDKVPGFILEETDEQTQYWRIIARNPKK